MKLVLAPAPIHHVHCRHNDGLCPHANQRIGYPRIAQVVTNAYPDSAPRGFPQLLFRRSQAVLEKLDRNAFDLAKYDVARRADYKDSVVEVGARSRILTAHNQVSLVMPAPIADGFWDGAVESVLTKGQEVCLWVHLHQFV